MAAMNRGPRPDDHIIVLFGATGDLARRKLLPGLFHLHAAGLLPSEYRVIGSAPKSSAMTDEQFRTYARQAAATFGITKPTDASWPSFAERLSFAAAEPGNTSALEEAVQQAGKEIAGPVRRLYYLAVPPAAFTSVIGFLGATGLARDARVVVEKPFGTDLDSARALNEAVHAVFDESQVFRIDHFLGKESVDNIFAFRFANGLFEPVWNRQHIRYVQIDVPETLSIEGRAAFYDATGAYRDMIVTHLLQVLGLVAMEPPVSLSAKSLRDEKAKVFQTMKPLDVRHLVRGQYDGSVRARGGTRFADGDHGRGAGRGGQLAPARRAVLPAIRQGHGRLAPGHHARLSPAADPDVSGPSEGPASRPDERDRHRFRRPGLDRR
jgi:glucose-6-phosphate 1-dehydrogenase